MYQIILKKLMIDFQYKMKKLILLINFYYQMIKYKNNKNKLLNNCNK